MNRAGAAASVKLKCKKTADFLKSFNCKESLFASVARGFVQNVNAFLTLFLCENFHIRDK